MTAPTSTPAKTAEDFLLSCWGGETPVDVVSLCRAAGVRVERSDDLGASVRGRIMGEGAAASRALVLSNIPDMMLRYILAHQLGHLCLGHLAIGAALDETSSTLSSNASGAEAQANEFALALLMPRRAFRFAIERKGATTIDKLSSLFGVSEVAVYQRLSHLGLLRAA